MVMAIWFFLALITNAHSFENLAYSRPVYELHPWPTTDKDYGSQNAVDGLYTDRSAAGGQCSISAENNYTEALLRIDLEAVVSISYITIYFRTENQQRPTVYTSKMAGFYLYASNTTSINDGYLCHHEIQTEVGTPSENQNISCSVHGRYITFYNERRPEVVYPEYYSKFAHNEVCEVEVYGCREPGTFGEKCFLKCPPNCQEKRCNISTGYCLGCLPGYRGPSCKDVCDEMSFGLECASNCSSCRNGTPCHHENGTCLQGCDEGVSGDMCQSVCHDGYYGITCSLRCSKNCYVPKRCDRFTGKLVEGCKPGWRTDSCELKCLDGFFGSECLKKCGFCMNVSYCHHINGSCLNGCSNGYKGVYCNEEHLAYRRPVHEIHPWPTTDKDYGSHNAVDGLYTDRSAAGGPTVYTSKMAGFFLYVSNTTSTNDGYLCFHDIQTKDDTPSENQNISCSVHGRYVTFYNERRPEVVYPSYYSEFAHNELCEMEVYGCREPGFFGEKCSLTCPTNCQEKRCNISTGYCLGCLPGYKGLSCKDVCDEMTFGLECAFTCSSCRNGTPCHHEHGTCLQGCDEGVYGNMCQFECRDGFYGKSCLHQCSENCYVTRRCDKITGKCFEGCKPGWRTDICDQKCLCGFFGSECLNKCDNCLNVGNCNHINGSCLKGCSKGYKGHYCKELCPKGYFGLDCLHICSTYCSGNESCNRFTGVCDEGFKDGRSNPKCGTRIILDESIGLESKVVIFFAVFVLVGLVVLIVILFRKEKDDSEPAMKKFRLRRKSSSEKEIVEPILKATKIIYDFGPPELNLFKYLAEEAHFLWEKENESHKDENEPMKGIVLIHDDDTDIKERCLHFFGLDLRSNKLESADCLLKGQQEIICVFLLRETFWKASNIAYEEVLNKVVKNIAKANVFFMVSNEDISRAYEFCERYNVCLRSNVISQAENKKVFYDTFYDILERQMTGFLHDLQARTITEGVTIEEELNGLIEELRARKKTKIPELTAQCLARIKEAKDYGVVGHRLLDNKLFVFVDGPLIMEKDKKTQLERFIKDSFDGTVKITPLRTVLKPHCGIKCGGYVTNNKISKSGTIGIFGKMRNLVKNDKEQTVALSSPNLFSDGDIASLPNGEHVGACCWPVKLEPHKENLVDVSIVEIDSTKIDTIKRAIFNEHILVEEIQYKDLNYQLVFKYGAKTQTTYGWIKKISNFELFGRDVLVIEPKSPATLFSDEGDSGAIVVTIINRMHHGIGMVFGSHLELEESSNKSTKIPTVAIFLKNALDRFTSRRKMSICVEEI